MGRLSHHGLPCLSPPSIPVVLPQGCLQGPGFSLGPHREPGDEGANPQGHGELLAHAWLGRAFGHCPRRVGAVYSGADHSCSHSHSHPSNLVRARLGALLSPTLLAQCLGWGTLRRAPLAPPLRLGKEGGHGLMAS